MNILSEPLKGCFVIQPQTFVDTRGIFVKTFHSALYTHLGLPTDWREEFYSTSSNNVLRGMHFQLSPHDHDKLVYCIRGRALDVALDLRRGTNFGTSAALELSSQNHLMFFIPRGVAHGFISLENDTVMVYKTTSLHAPTHDKGILWSSFGFNWPTATPIVSVRDQSFPSLAEFSLLF
jgi:dTDP-4-dehydrorhamnose 3,5-epimerase/CDP-3, 6-dideoxy-D-glycero-D-glycero-4-hexulose-5-epimerase